MSKKKLWKNWAEHRVQKSSRLNGTFFPWCECVIVCVFMYVCSFGWCHSRGDDNMVQIKNVTHVCGRENVYFIAVPKLSNIVRLCTHAHFQSERTSGQMKVSHIKCLKSKHSGKNTIYLEIKWLLSRTNHITKINYGVLCAENCLLLRVWMHLVAAMQLSALFSFISFNPLSLTLLFFFSSSWLPFACARNFTFVIRKLCDWMEQRKRATFLFVHWLFSFSVCYCYHFSSCFSIYEHF